MSAFRVVTVAVVTACLAGPASAQRGITNNLRESDTLLELLEPVCECVDRSVVAVRSGRRLIALGTVVDARGLILTKRSELAGKLQCDLAGGRRVEAREVAFDRDYDLALLQVDVDEPLVPVQWAKGTTYDVGSIVVSSGRRGAPAAFGVIGTGPQKIEPGKAMLGVEMNNRTAEISRVLPGTAAEEIGLLEGDQVIAVGEAATDDYEAVTLELGKLRVGDEVSIRVRRGASELELEALLGDWEDEERVEGSRSRFRSGFPLAFRHDGVLEPQECGSPVLDLDGRVVGLNIARAGRTVSYAIPAPAVTKALTSMLAKLETTPVAVEPKAGSGDDS